MSSDENDPLCYTPLQRSQVSSSQRRSNPYARPSRLSLSQRSARPSRLSLSQRSHIQNKKKSKEVNKNTERNTPKKLNKNTGRNTPRKPQRPSKNNTPVKSRADKPEDNCTEAELAKWKFLYGSNDSKDDQGGGSLTGAPSLPASQKRKSSSEEAVHQSESKKPNGGVCSRCQFPCSSFELKRAHSVRCERRDLSPTSRCPKGASCSSTDEQHYWLYYHIKHPQKTHRDSSRLFRDNEASDGLKNLMNDYSSSGDSGFKGAAGSSASRKPLELCDSPDYVAPSDPEETYDIPSVPLFELESTDSEIQEDPRRRGSLDDSKKGDSSGHTRRNSSDHSKRNSSDYASNSPHHARRDSTDFTEKVTADHINRDSTSHTRDLEDHTRDSVASNSTAGSNLLLPLIPDIHLSEGDDSTVYFSDGGKSQKSSPFNKDEQAVHQSPPVSHFQDDASSGSRTTDLERTEGEQNVNGHLDDSEGDELVGSVVEEALTNYVVPAVEKVLQWRKESEEAFPSSSQENRARPSSRGSQRRFPPPPCIHLHFHEAIPAQTPAPQPGKEKGQTSILKFFKSSKPEEETCTCGGNRSAPKEGVAAWKGLMERMQKKRELVPLPTVSESSSLSILSDGTSTGYRQKSQVKTCPFYKWIPECNFVVDAFNYGSIDGVKAYFLSHFHYDHYVGLRKIFNHPIYCSEITARLVNKKIGVPWRYLKPLPLYQPQEVHGVEVTLLDANHCPGAVMFLFKVKPGVTHLHVGDFRAHPLMENYPALNCSINTLFLDTTYCSPEYDFPSQDKIIEKCVSIVQDHHQKNNKTLFVVGSYTIGKERVFKAVAESLDCSIWVKSFKKPILNCIDDKTILSRLTDDQKTAMVHVLSMREVQGTKLKEYLNQMKPSFTEIVGLCPTGWEFQGASGCKDPNQISPKHPFPDVHIYGVPYSEHSSFSELRKFVQFIQPRKIIPTVNNGNQGSRKRMEKHFRDWLAGRQLFH